MMETKSFVFTFEDFEVNEREFLIRRAGKSLAVEPKAFRVLLVLLRNPQKLVTKEELLDAVWDDCNVSENSLVRSVARLRSTLGDDPRDPRYIATVPTVGYRFICEVERAEGETATTVKAAEMGPEVDASPIADIKGVSARGGGLANLRWMWIIVASSILFAIGSLLFWKARPGSSAAVQRPLSRLTFSDGLQIDATWSPDSRFFAYSSDRGGKFDVWIQQASGGDPVQVTHESGHSWQPEWSPDGRYIAYRSEAGDGGLYAMPALGGAGQKIKLSSFGYYPHWSPDSQSVLFQTAMFAGKSRLYVAPLDARGPHEVLNSFVTEHSSDVISANWYPDGKRISVWLWNPLAGLHLSTLPVEGGAALQTEIPREAARQLGDPPWSELADDFRFSWAKSGGAVYFEQTLGGAKNIWKLQVDPATLEATALERLTTGQGPDIEPVVSPDGKQVIYTAGSRKVRAWVFPLDADGGRLLGAGTPIVSASMEGWHPSVSRDGSRLIVDAQRGGKEQLWRKELPDGDEAPLMADAFVRGFPEWSPDGRRLAYVRHDPSTKESRLMVWSSEDGEETPFTDGGNVELAATDWSADGKTLLYWKAGRETGRMEVWSLPVSAAPHGESASRRLISNPEYDIFQAHFSPDGRWIVFEAIKYHSAGDESSVYVTPADGGPWTRLSDGNYWDDKPRWSPNGKLVYFLSARGGFLNVWATRFDPVRGGATGAPWQITKFDRPDLMIPKNLSAVEISISRNKLALTVAELSGNVWAIGNVDR